MPRGSRTRARSHSPIRTVLEGLEGRSLAAVGLLAAIDSVHPAIWREVFEIEAGGGSARGRAAVDRFLGKLDHDIDRFDLASHRGSPRLEHLDQRLDAMLEPPKPQTIPTAQPPKSPPTPTVQPPVTPPSTPTGRAGQPGPLPVLTQDQVDTAYLNWFFSETTLPVLRVVKAGWKDVPAPHPMFPTPQDVPGTTLVPGLPWLVAAPNATALYAEVGNLVPEWGNEPVDAQQIYDELRIPPTVLSYRWDLSKAPDVVSRFGNLDSENIELGWDPPQPGTYTTDQVTVTATLADGRTLTQTFHFLIFGAADPVFRGANLVYPQPSQALLNRLMPE